MKLEDTPYSQELIDLLNSIEMHNDSLKHANKMIKFYQANLRDCRLEKKVAKETLKQIQARITEIYKEMEQ